MKKILIFTLTISLFLIGCSGESSEKESTTPDFAERVSFKKWEDDWVLKMDIYQDDRTKEDITHVTLTGFNVKYKTIDGYNAKILDENKKIVGSVNRSMPYLGDNSVYNAELEKIHDYFTEKKYQENITVEDIADLDVTVFDKGLLVEMYNEALQMENPEEMKYWDLPAANCKQMKLSNSDTIQVSYILGYGNIGFLNIEYIYSDGVYLSDLVNQKRANDSQVKAYDSLEKIENKITKENEWDVDFDVSFGDDSDSIHADLKTLLNNTFTKVEE